MKRIAALMGVILLIGLFGASCEARADSDTFSFSARLSFGYDVVSGTPFSITVTTENTSGADYLYRGSSTVVGAIIELSAEVDGRKVTYQPTAVPITNDYRETLIKNGERIVYTWHFGEYEPLIPATYDLHIAFEGEKEVVEDFLTVQ